MARVKFDPEMGADLERILEHLSRYEVTDTPTRIREIIEGTSFRSTTP